MTHRQTIYVRITLKQARLLASLLTRADDAEIGEPFAESMASSHFRSRIAKMKDCEASKAKVVPHG